LASAKYRVNDSASVLRKRRRAQPNLSVFIRAHLWLIFRVPVPKKISARQRVLAQWRGVDLSPLETARTVRARAAGDVLTRVLSELRMDDRRAEAELVKAWNSLVDPNIVAHAQPAGLRKGTLFVNVDSNVWLSEIVRYRRKEILDRLQHCFGRNLIQKISFRVG
jgi:predicted nucleic acid-binding Zn ribbon protein